MGRATEQRSPRLGVEVHHVETKASGAPPVFSDAIESEGPDPSTSVHRNERPGATPSELSERAKPAALERDMSGQAENLRAKANKCREVARRMDDDTRARLIRLAEAYEAEAAALDEVKQRN